MARQGRSALRPRVDDLIRHVQAQEELSERFHDRRAVQKTQTYTASSHQHARHGLARGHGRDLRSIQRTLGNDGQGDHRCRQLLLEAVKPWRTGKRARVDPSTYERVRPYDAVVPVGKTWRRNRPDWSRSSKRGVLDREELVETDDVQVRSTGVGMLQGDAVVFVLAAEASSREGWDER